MNFNKKNSMTILNDEGKRRKGGKEEKLLKYVIKPWQVCLFTLMYQDTV